MIRPVGVLLLIAATAWPQPAAVLCIVPGGHVAIEPGPDRCDTSADAVQDECESAHAALAPAGTCCAPCTDVPLGTRVMGGAGRPDDHLHALAEAAGPAPGVLPAIADLAASLPPPAHGRAASVRPPSPANIRGTIVLRC